MAFRQAIYWSLQHNGLVDRLLILVFLVNIQYSGKGSNSSTEQSDGRPSKVYLRDAERLLHGGMGGLLRYAFLQGRDALWCECVADDALSGYRLKPCAGGSVASIDELEVVAVAGEGVADRRSVWQYLPARAHRDAGRQAPYGWMR